ncbi:hypothetical protein Goe24_01050 [Bacillus phage vB_BsuM-Goe24]|nr:hypothetical protein Goe24_01050 [Bacillus phage vB_BsuM-Goe24]
MVTSFCVDISYTVCYNLVTEEFINYKEVGYTG